MSQKQQQQLSDYEVIKQIGKGSFGLVQQIKRKSDGKILVWKELNYGKMSDREKQQLVAEVNIIRELKHDNIVKYYDRIIDKKSSKIYIIMEYCEGGDMGILLKKCKKEKDYIAEDVIWKIFTQIVTALNECHNKKSGKILHRDLKPANIFLDAQNNIKLGDFGLSKHMSDQSVFTYTHVGTPYYMSPEQINESKYNEKSDIWSAGCLLYEMAALQPPFQATNHLSLAIKIKAGKFDRLPMRYSEELQRLVTCMITVEQDKRPSIEQLIQIPQISLRLKEKKLRERHAIVKQNEHNLKIREQEIQDKNKEKQNKIEELKQKIMGQKLKNQEIQLRIENLEIQNQNQNNFQKQKLIVDQQQQQPLSKISSQISTKDSSQYSLKSQNNNSNSNTMNNFFQNKRQQRSKGSIQNTSYTNNSNINISEQENINYNTLNLAKYYSNNSNIYNSNNNINLKEQGQDQYQYRGYLKGVISNNDNDNQIKNTSMKLQKLKQNFLQNKSNRSQSLIRKNILSEKNQIQVQQ